MTESPLTTEEIKKLLPSDAFHLAEDDLKSGQKIAHAQLVKVVKWLYGECGKLEHGQAIRRHRILCPKCMAELKELAK